MGIVLYELLTGRRPFDGGDRRKTIERIKTLEPRPPRQIDDSIPKELERMCLKALAKPLTDRYPTALDLSNFTPAVREEHRKSQRSIGDLLAMRRSYNIRSRPPIYGEAG